MSNAKSGNIIGVIVIYCLFSHDIFSDTWHAHGKSMNINPHWFTHYFTFFARVDCMCTYWNYRYKIVTYFCIPVFSIFRICNVYFPLIIVYVSLYTRYDIRHSRVLYTLLLFRLQIFYIWNFNNTSNDSKFPASLIEYGLIKTDYVSILNDNCYMWCFEITNLIGCLPTRWHFSAFASLQASF